MSNTDSDEPLQDIVDRLEGEVAELRRSRKRLARAAHDDRRAFEGALHDGVQQHLVAFAVELRRLAAAARRRDRPLRRRHRDPRWRHLRPRVRRHLGIGLEAVRRSASSPIFVAIVLGLASITEVLRFQAVRLRELPVEAVR